MDLCVTIKGVSFILQTGLGILGNAVVLLAYAHILYLDRRLQPVDNILCHLVFVNFLQLLTRCVPLTMTVFGLKILLNDPSCKVLIYAYRTSRSVSVCITCMLSVFQAVTLSPDGGPRWSRLKDWLPSLVLPTFVGLWCLNLVVCIAAPLFTIAPRNSTAPPFTLNLGYCHVDFQDSLSYVINGAGLTVRDFSFVGLMLWSSSYILLVLHRHRRKVRNIRKGQGGRMESRAAKTVITLVVLYTVFFGLDNVIWVYMLTVAKVSPDVADMKVFFSSSYSFLSPYFIISSNKKVKSRITCTASDQEQQSVDTQESNDKV